MSKERVVKDPLLQLRGGPQSLTAYWDQWVAIADGEVKASGATGGEVIKKAWAMGIKRPMVCFVSRHRFVG